MQFFFLLPLRTFLCLSLLKTFNFVDLVTDDVISWSRYFKDVNINRPIHFGGTLRNISLKIETKRKEGKGGQ